MNESLLYRPVKSKIGTKLCENCQQPLRNTIKRKRYAIDNIELDIDKPNSSEYTDFSVFKEVYVEFYNIDT